jgi:hypothetical protein
MRTHLLGVELKTDTKLTEKHRLGCVLDEIIKKQHLAEVLIDKSCIRDVLILIVFRLLNR